MSFEVINFQSTKIPHYVGMQFTRVTPELRAKLSALIPVQPLFHSLPEDDFYTCWRYKMKVDERSLKSINFQDLSSDVAKQIIQEIVKEIFKYLQSKGTTLTSSQVRDIAMQPNFIVNFALFPLQITLSEEFIKTLKVLREQKLKFLNGFLKGKSVIKEEDYDLNSVAIAF